MLTDQITHRDKTVLSQNSLHCYALMLIRRFICINVDAKKPRRKQTKSQHSVQ